MMRTLVAASAILWMAQTVRAEGKHATYRFVDKRGVGAEYIMTPAAQVSHVIYLDRCVGGCSLTPGNDGTQNQSEIISTSKQLSAYQGTDASWAAIVACVKSTYAPFNVTITDQRPTSGAYHHAMVAGSTAQLGEPAGVLGVSPFSCGNYIPNSMSFSFANEEPTNVNDICWTVSQETAHSWGLDHKLDKLDPMTYLANGNVQKIFQNQAGSCGENQVRQCTCSYPGTGASAINSYALVLATFGAGTPDTTPPTVSITSPANNASVMPGFAITANAGDDNALAKVDFTLDGQLVGTSTSTPFHATAPATLSQGSHHLVATATDSAGNTATAAIDVMYGSDCTQSGCTDTTQVCVGGHCEAGPDTSGGLGSPCLDNASCASGSCGDDGAGNKYCVSPCDTTAATDCPSGFGCLQTTGTAGVCWPGADNGGGGGCNSSGDSSVILVGLGFAATLVTRRRRQS